MDTLAASRTVIADRPEPGWWYRESLRSSLHAILIAVIGGALIGSLTSFGQGYLPEWVNSLSNSVGGWTMFCFLIVWLGRARPVLAAVLGALVFQLLVESYSVVSEWRGFDDGDPFTSVWTVAGLVAGPFLGTTAGLVRHAPPLWRALAVTPLCAVLLGEGLWALTAVAGTTSPVYWGLEIVLSVVFLLAAVLRCRLEPRVVPVVVCVWLVGTLAYIGVIVGILS
ncbi:DUF6518 family protein [Cryobacterium sp. PAMC25264]|uniref:DUF6518 family protein n=1 Tax=Cryobacterium sp. PAMC25264 TaxID=2861288 RepID=UPI001C630B2C|nr:DUF6518 family protein [Cryobacterium sp. PAMC25264]QYF74969.1 hypothetical protein KY500_07580 [Cryobacterium sp. PAMC25264]